MKYGNYRVVGKVIKGKTVYQVRRGMVLINSFNDYGKAVSDAIQLDRAERKLGKAAKKITKTGLKYGKKAATAFLDYLFEEKKPKKRKKKKTIKKKKKTKRRK